VRFGRIGISYHFPAAGNLVTESTGMTGSSALEDIRMQHPRKRTGRIFIKREGKI
jgi:hypothetical protein